MASIVSYNNEKVVVGEVEYPASDPASGAFFQPDYKKNEDLKTMLDGSKDSLKLEAMKRIIGMIAKGRDASDLFPAVVKNVVSKNIEVKKLVYVYLVRYAEEQQDLALLSISTFQRALKDPNQLIRASALRVLSSIRVNMIVPIVMLAIRDSSSDMSPYVRKTAAHAIPKLYSLDPEQKEELVSIIDKLLSDKAPLVVGSAAMAFTEVCPDRMSLIHRSYRKLCSLLADVDEWGQLALLNVLTVYARTCFPDPNSEEYMSESETEKPFYESSGSGASGAGPRAAPAAEPDLRLLLRAAKPLLQSRNAGVVTAVAQLYYHCAPAQELPPVAKAMIRLLRAPLEVQSVVLNSIASLTVNKRCLFEPFLKYFFVRNSDPTHIKLLKLEILTNLATEASAAVVLREFQTYVTSSDKTFAASTIQAIGRLAVAIHTETEHCLNGLLHLLSSKDEWVVCEAVVVVKRVVGGGAASAKAAVSRAAKLLRADRLGGAARAAAVWLVAEHGARHPRAAAVLAHLASSFTLQDELVKLQLLSLSVKLSITQPATAPVCGYVMSLARYDASYDVRDRARMLRRLLDPPASSQLARFKEHIFMPDKPKPTVESSFKDRQQWTLGTLSQYVGSPAAGYRPLPPPPATPQFAALRDAADTPVPQSTNDTAKTPKNKSFYSEPESSGSGSESSSESSSEESSDEDKSANESDKKEEKPAKENNNYRSSKSGSSSSDSDSDSSSASDSGSETPDSSDDEGQVTQRKNDKANKESSEQTAQKNEKSNLELLLELDEVAESLPTMTPTCGGFLSPPDEARVESDDITPVGPSYVAPPRELVSRVSLGGLSATLQWPRAPHLYSHRCTAAGLAFTNHSAHPLTDINVTKKASSSQEMLGFQPIARLAPGETAEATLGVHFADSIQPLDATLSCSLGEISISITPPIGELMRAVTMSEARWVSEQRRLRGMTECVKKTVRVEDEATICKRVFATANLAFISSTGELLRFAGRMLSSQDLVFLSVKVEADCNLITANCPNMAVASILANDLANKFKV